MKKGAIITTSLDVAEKFGKRHDLVLRTIRNLDCSHDFSLLNFAERNYIDDRGKKQPMYEITRDGFSFLAMGFTGKKAAGWREKYITAFNAMEHVLLNQSNLAFQELRRSGKVIRIEATDTIKDFVEYATAQGSSNAKHYYANITKATNKALSLVKQTSGNHFRDMLDNMQLLSYLQTAEFIACNALKEGMTAGLDYKDIYQLCKKRIEAFASTVRPSLVINS
ncbi:MAG: hypothetical protein A2511_17010 [Deltaproteobacteria bacterium RIFOXYD12_FULL_50_9]|nr:MAG: hypothetical protein A2511_17010 [Deltaproteobacteria bacterium RIFOXYD12_FULL_50_9]